MKNVASVNNNVFDILGDSTNMYVNGTTPLTLQISYAYAAISNFKSTKSWYRFHGSNNTKFYDYHTDRSIFSYVFTMTLLI